MQTIDEILQTLRRLEPDQRKRVRAELDALEQGKETPGEDTSNGAYDALLELAGAGTSDHTDVSSNKNKYLAGSYATRP
jgi:hypothetical protein